MTTNGAAVTRRSLIGGAAALAAAPVGAAPRAAAPRAAPPAPEPPAPILDAAASDPVRLGWMVGSPPTTDRVITAADPRSRQFPRTRWTFSHIRELVPTAPVPRGGKIWKLPVALRADIDAVRFDPLPDSDLQNGMTWAESLAANYTDGILVLHRGRIVHERYFGALNAERPHVAFSVTKSYVGVLVATLIAEGTVDAAAPIEKYIPELGPSGFAGASVRDLLDMRSGVRFSEDYTDPRADIAAYAFAAGNTGVRPPGYSGPQSLADYLPTLGREAPSGGNFRYQTANTQVLGWLLHRVTGTPLRELLSERIWRPLGAEQDGYFGIDPKGFDQAGGGFNAALRDQARFGEAMRLGGVADGRRILPKSVVADIAAGGDRAAFATASYARLPGWSYRNQWWVTHNDHGAYTARGIYGQAIYVDPTAEMVIARFASHPMAANSNFDATSLPAYHAVARHLMR